MQLMAPKTIKATIRDVSSYNAPNESLYVYFEPKDLPLLPPRHNDPLILELPNGTYTANIALTRTNRPNLNQPLQGPGHPKNCTKALKELGCDHGDALLFSVTMPRQRLKLLRILPGEGPPPRPGPKRHKPSKATRKSTVQSHKTATTSDGSKLEELEKKTVLKWAKCYWGLITLSEAEAERQFEAAFSKARKRSYLAKDLFISVGAWKSRRSIRLLSANSPKEIKRHSMAAFDANSREAAILAMRELSGVGTRMAVAMLHWMRPNEFPMIDVRIVQSVGWAEPQSWDDLTFYETLADHIQKHARRISVSLRDIDRALWAIDKAHQKSR
jgi:hypothetical protein